LLFRRKACACSARFFCQGSALRSDERLTTAALDSADGHAQGARLGRAFVFCAPPRVALKAKTQTSSKEQER